MRGLSPARPDDRIIISESDDIPKPGLLQRALGYHGLSRRIVAFWCDNFIFRLNLRNDGHDHRLGPRLLTRGALQSPQAIREIQFRFSKRRYLRPLAASVASQRVFRRLGTFLWPTIIWHGAWHFTHMGGLDVVNLKITSDSHADENTQLTNAMYQARMASLIKCPLDDLPPSVRQDRFAHLIA
jgi:beta-1,4-mannosyl-glycoprotein beta-1,4-N-acetylglucosaminyltransferase